MNAEDEKRLLDLKEFAWVKHSKARKIYGPLSEVEASRWANVYLSCLQVSAAEQLVRETRMGPTTSRQDPGTGWPR